MRFKERPLWYAQTRASRMSSVSSAATGSLRVWERTLLRTNERLVYVALLSNSGDH